MSSSLFTFPNPVNEKAARVVAGGVVILSVITLAGFWLTDRPIWWLLTIPLTLGFAARLAAGPKLSLLGQLATKVIAPRLGEPVLTPGPPKRFAQGIGLVFSLASAILSLGFGQYVAASIVLGILTIFAILESVFNFCAGCFVFGLLIRAGVIPSSVCEACANFDPKRTPSLQQAH